MTAAPQEGTADSSEAVGGDAAAVAETFVQLMRSFTRIRAQMVAAHDVEWSAQMVLKRLAHDGPMRSSTLAEHIQADPSTVSRQVAALVREGLIERRADPEDGRACLLVLTDRAGEVLRDHDEVRNEQFGRMLAGWSERDLARFAVLLRRFTHDFETASTDWLSESAEIQRSSAEGKH
jgi:DNA-binding MarR family transcriptional regulator